MERGVKERNRLSCVIFPEGQNFSSTFRSEAKEKFRVASPPINND